MATQVDHRTKVGSEGVGMVEEYYSGRTGWSAGRTSSTQLGHRNLVHHKPPYQQDQLPFVYYGPCISTVKLPVIASNERMQRYGGIIEEPVITKDQATRYDGGVLIVEHRGRKPFPGA